MDKDSKNVDVLSEPFEIVDIQESNRPADSLVHRFASSFKKQENVELEDVNLTQMNKEQRQNYNLAHQSLHKTLSERHLTMIAIGGTLGTGLFIGIGYSLASGPGSLLLGFSIVGLMMFCVVQSAAEMACQYPVAGSFAMHVSRFVEPSLGFAVATSYVLLWLVSLPSELIGCAMTIRYWNNSVNPAVWVAIFYVLIMFLNLFGARGFGETEFWLSLFKVLAVIIFIIIGIVLICGGGPHSDGYIGARYWHNPGSFAKPVFKGICSTFVSAAYSFSGTELVVLTASESRNVESVSRAAKGTFWRITIFYIVTVVVIGCLVPYTNENLLGGSNGEDVSASPFVIALKNQGSMGKSVSNFMNLVILISVFSVCNSSVYASSRIIQALGACGQLPRACAYVDKKGRPLVGIAVCGAFGLLGFIASSESQDKVFTWLFALCSIAIFFTWLCISAAHVRYRMALRAHGRSTSEIVNKSLFGIYGAILGVVLNALLIIGEIYVSIFPLGKKPSAENFFENCLSIPIIMAVYLVHKVFFNKEKRLMIPLDQVDLDIGRRMERNELLEEEYHEAESGHTKVPLHRKLYRVFC
ncbi:amino acid permease LALA0_S12e00232g [Lachancea lanzarotensis]|uniref:LALA0S12e00232g1_1 n=1 Tax=Lachancea lanzarotensis TaxID=1245769 RepID=A0A0C7NDV9_9SACH|nr:uncharacterized protein LALA0_S12e00232g [Lachancea lanzarotensis]CEP64501.1 LALA0S12e00232g1_1 [Lachancea lanzarotensis]